MENFNFGLIYKKYSKTKTIISSLAWSLLLGLIITIFVSYLMGYRVYSVLGHSSEPNIHYGSIVIDYKIPFEDLKVGDYVTWSLTGKSFVTHRIIAIDEENQTITTSQTDYYANIYGDGTVTPDKPLTAKFYYGKVILTIPYIGQLFYYIRSLILTPYNTLNISGIFSIILAYLTAYYFSKLVSKKYFEIKWGNLWKKSKKIIKV